MKTYNAPANVEHNWVVIDATDVVVGRLASYVAKRLRGKHRADFTPHIDTGDHVVIINADKVKFTGRKMTDKVYYRHTGYPGGIKSTTPEKILNGRFPERALELAVKRMMPKESPLARKQFSKLHVYGGAEHPHEAQKPDTVDFKAMNRKNIKAA
ncbi:MULTISPECIES: 50S ribosomal protein L13 [unclassified Hyphomonas]|jgi:large subunit ribosomal protein L13|uniref:Large ribosomal subunit protein uL13c n=5 Tax=root TaxID=1 RepID=A0A7S0YWP9_9CRYP|nr:MULTISPECIES: 50S ribosomal protein L13 [unclassified Hyphomonas]MAN90733.1 50S ribosomal protein L13 [Hyphomonadaceae bacterium]KCZ65722.1 50S ribosomal protein L13 [Hyphomonas sp. L-53-1-40]MAA83718.1 50S ribosomal protein L13 [Hyphomonas sp.]MAL46366.1 50S ribosomal protein L13 [Hyphomonas sp.]MAX84482.1 50S ribosomal protein L13 [Hyphomonas sp.]|tara:strand:- start:6396 stop:6860 length:465 start_codon:yes stop_codon:yes gene_type:complete|mmetsp:Transcript_26279/g.66844  ORF Transcript_26279/g.66844 Transcript_26279/m.66844 type:complete len:155 (+) Transcript_26279:167-631(+)